MIEASAPTLAGPRHRRARFVATTVALLVLAVTASCRPVRPGATNGAGPSETGSFVSLAPTVHQPCGMAAARNAVWVLACGGSVVRVDTRSGERTSVSVEDELVGMDGIAGKGGDAAWVLTAAGAGTTRRGAVAVVADGATVRSIDLGTAVPMHAAFAGDRLWVATVDGRLFVVEGDSARPVAEGPPLVWVVADGERPWTVSEEGDVVERAADGTARRTFTSVLANASAAGAGLGSVWLASDRGLVRLDVATGRTTAVGVGGTVNDIVSCGGSVWISQADLGVRALDARGATVRSVPLDVAPAYLLCDGNRLRILSEDGALGSIAIS